MSRSSLLCLILLPVTSVACSNPEKERIKQTTQATYDEETGRLNHLTADINKDGKVDAYTYMDGTKILRTEVDADQDGKIEKWDYHYPEAKLVFDTSKPDGTPRKLLDVSRLHELGWRYRIGLRDGIESFEEPEYTAGIVAVGTLRLLDSVADYINRTGHQVRFYQAGSSEMFGATAPPQSEGTAFYPRSPYAASKVAAHWFTVNYREAYGLFACNGILFNHESPRRGETFVTRKITRAAGRIKAGLQQKLYLGNLDAKRDWGFARDYVEAMWLMLQQPAPDDDVVATGESYSVRDFLGTAFEMAGLEWRDFVEVDPRYLRATEVDCLQGELVRMMVEHDIELAQQEETLRKAGHTMSLRGRAAV